MQKMIQLLEEVAVLPFSIFKHTEAYPQVSGHLGDDQDPADENER